jgi:hypothetical protein
MADSDIILPVESRRELPAGDGAEFPARQSGWYADLPYRRRLHCGRTDVTVGSLHGRSMSIASVDRISLVPRPPGSRRREGMRRHAIEATSAAVAERPAPLVDLGLGRWIAKYDVVHRTEEHAFRWQDAPPSQSNGSCGLTGRRLRGQGDAKRHAAPARQADGNPPSLAQGQVGY